MPIPIVPIVQSHIGSEPGKPTVEAPMNTPLPSPQTKNRTASRFGFRFVASTANITTAPTAKDVHASSGVFGS